MPKRASKKPTPKPDWQEIASALYRECLFAIEYLKGRDGSETLIDRKTNKMRHWKERMADSMELIPGVKVDRDAMHACGLPRKERQKWFANREKEAQTKSK